MTSPFLRIFDLAQMDPERLYARFGERDITIGDVARNSEAVARILLASGLTPGARVAVMMENRPLTISLIFGIARAGMVWVPINTRQQGDSLAYQLGHCRPALLIVDEALLAKVRDCGADDGHLAIHSLADDADTLDLPNNGRADALPAPVEAGETFAIMYTSGTTGAPKGVQVTHRMFDYAARAVSIAGGIEDGDVMFVWEPLYHIGGSQLLLLPLMHRVHLHLVRRFSASGFWGDVHASGATHIHFLGGILQILLRNPPSPNDRGHRVRVAWGGGCARDDWQAFEHRFGVDIREAYGMTEASSITTINVGGPVGSVGKPVPWFKVELLDEAGQPVPPGERGEIVVSELEEGALFKGYLDAPEANARVLRGGRLFTGDVGIFSEDGWLTFQGRLNDSIRRRGENISAWEIESAALKHPAIAEVAMIGVKADIGEQEIKLFVRPADGHSIDAPQLHGWLTEQLGRYRAPRYIAFVDSFPKTPSERIRKGLLPQTTDDCWDAESHARTLLTRTA
ncbi:MULTISPECIES: class I adenylate-forming enzyme family protein [Chelativorans]|jgi:crotonobetaine/carnitine-CoA ligase|uniref:AMP-dependent synthetase and ligase n=1 Tax=Chelativorans sp. (strain BNC1) TaxID=266779 RepID=Q11C67_CHESB|nr:MULTISPECIES: AMP-binding protein [Chelativorans]